MDIGGLNKKDNAMEREGNFRDKKKEIGRKEVRNPKVRNLNLEKGTRRHQEN